MRLTHFRSTHAPKHVVVSDAAWSYISSGHGERVVVLLPGALASHDSLFHLVEALEDDYRVIAISLSPSAAAIGEIVRGVSAVLEAESVKSAVLIGSSYGGWVAQEFAQRRPETVIALVLLNTFTVRDRSNWKKRVSRGVALGMLGMTPNAILDALLRLRIRRILLAPLAAAAHDDLESWQCVAAEAISSGTIRRMAAQQAMVLSAAGEDGNGTDSFAGPVLIIESNDDPAISAAARRDLKSRHRGQDVLTIGGTGHISSILATGEVVRSVKAFLTRPVLPPR